MRDQIDGASSRAVVAATYVVAGVYVTLAVYGMNTGKIQLAISMLVLAALVLLMATIIFVREFQYVWVGE